MNYERKILRNYIISQVVRWH